MTRRTKKRRCDTRRRNPGSRTIFSRIDPLHDSNLASLRFFPAILWSSRTSELKLPWNLTEKSHFFLPGCSNQNSELERISPRVVSTVSYGSFVPLVIESLLHVVDLFLNYRVISSFSPRLKSSETLSCRNEKFRNNICPKIKQLGSRLPNFDASHQNMDENVVQLLKQTLGHLPGFRNI